MGRCPRCGLTRSTQAEFCPACGFEFPQNSDSTSSYQTRPPPIPIPQRQVPQVPPSGRTAPTPLIPLRPKTPTENESYQFLQDEAEPGGFFRVQSIQGVVIHIDGPYMVKPGFDWMKVVLFFLLLPVLLGAGMAFLVVYVVFALFSGGRSGSGGLLSNVTSQVLSFFLTGKLFGPKEQISVRDVRLRLKSGEEQLARVKGDLVLGNFNVGDEVVLTGRSSRGTLMVSGGTNLRTRSEIKISRR